MTNISEGYARSLSQYSTDQITNQISFLDVMCGKSPEEGKPSTCETCLNTFVDMGVFFPCEKDGKRAPCVGGKCPDGTACDPPTKHKDLIEFVNHLGGSMGSLGGAPNPAGVCAPSCQCSVKDVVFNNVILVDRIAKIERDSPKIEEIQKYVAEQMTKMYGQSYVASENNQHIADIVVNITDTATQNISQMTTAFQTVSIRGGSAQGIHLSIVVDGVMKAIVQNSNSLNIISEITSRMISRIRRQVDSEILGNFSFIWNQIKWQVIGVGIFILLLLIFIAYRLVFMRPERSFVRWDQSRRFARRVHRDSPREY